MNTLPTNRFLRAYQDGVNREYHAHVYYQQGEPSYQQAKTLHQQIIDAHITGVTVDRDLKTAPDLPFHKQTEFEIAIKGADNLGKVLHALTKIRQGLPILLHENNDYRLEKTHLDEGVWIGGKPPKGTATYIDKNAFKTRQLYWDDKARADNYTPVNYDA